MVKERSNNKYLRISLIKPHLCVTDFDRISLPHCDDVTDIRSDDIQNVIKFNHKCNCTVQKVGSLNLTLLDFVCTNKLK